MASLRMQVTGTQKGCHWYTGGRAEWPRLRRAVHGDPAIPFEYNSGFMFKMLQDKTESMKQHASWGPKGHPFYTGAGGGGVITPAKFPRRVCVIQKRTQHDAAMIQTR